MVSWTFFVDHLFINKLEHVFKLFVSRIRIPKAQLNIWYGHDLQDKEKCSQGEMSGTYETFKSRGLCVIVTMANCPFLCGVSTCRGVLVLRAALDSQDMTYTMI